MEKLMSNKTKTQQELHAHISRAGKLYLPVNVYSLDGLDDCDDTQEFIDKFIRGKDERTVVWIEVDTDKNRDGPIISEGSIYPVKSPTEGLEYLYVSCLVWGLKGPDLRSGVLPCKYVESTVPPVFENKPDAEKKYVYRFKQGRGHESNPEDASSPIWLNEDNMKFLLVLWRVNPYLPNGKKMQDAIPLDEIMSLCFPK